MNDQDVEDAKVKLDAELKNARVHVGIKFGSDLFQEFSKRGYFKDQKFVAVGLPSLELTLPTYDNRYASQDIEIELDRWRVGK